MSEAAREHKQHAAGGSIATAVLTISDTRTLETDTSGEAIVRHLTSAGHDVADRGLVRDEPDDIRTALAVWITRPDVRVVITTGGTGLSRRDTTVEVVRDLVTTEIEGFGELFRMISYEQIGSPAMLSRAVAGLVVRDATDGGDTFVFALPGSTNAVTTAMSKLVLPEMGHLVGQRR